MTVQFQMVCDACEKSVIASDSKPRWLSLEMRPTVLGEGEYSGRKEVHACSQACALNLVQRVAKGIGLPETSGTGSRLPTSE